MKRLLLPPLFKLFNKSTFLSSLNQNTCPVLDAEEIKKLENIAFTLKKNEEIKGSEVFN